MSATVGFLRAIVSSGDVFLGDVNENFAAINFDGMGFQVNADRSALGGTSCIVKAPVVLGALDGVIHHQAISQMNLLMRAQAVGGIVFVVR